MKLYALGARSAMLSGRLPAAAQTLAQLQQRLHWSAAQDSAIEERVAAILATVQARGPAGLGAAIQDLLEERLPIIEWDYIGVPPGPLLKYLVLHDSIPAMGEVSVSIEPGYTAGGSRAARRIVRRGAQPLRPRGRA